MAIVLASEGGNPAPLAAVLGRNYYNSAPVGPFAYHSFADCLEGTWSEREAGSRGRAEARGLASRAPAAVRVLVADRGREGARGSGEAGAAWAVIGWGDWVDCCDWEVDRPGEVAA